MLRMTLILCVGMYAALMIAGVDRGQLRPGLAEAVAKAAKAPAEVVAAADSEPEAIPEPVVAEAVETPDPAAADAEPVVAETAVAEAGPTP
ncbi:MAG: hypothetical protein J0L76_19425 [Rhodobacterales bacterium]|nr:hypothetical protein [Rhodobacterales bacterium]